MNLIVSPEDKANLNTFEKRTIEAQTYIGIRKVNWDQRWHVLYTTKDGKETYNRVSQKLALIILGNFSNASSTKGTVIFSSVI